MVFSTSHDSPHHRFAALVGGWTGSSSTWLEPGAEPMQAPIQGSIQLVLDGRFALFLYQSMMDSEPQHGIFTFGFNTLLERYEASWIDSFHNNTAMMFCIGAEMEQGFSVLGSYPDPSGGPDWGWRTEVRSPNLDHMVITAYNITPDGQEFKAVETLLTKVKK